MRVLGIDPGKHNVAWALLENGQIHSYGHIQHTLSDLACFPKQVKILRKEIIALLRQVELDKSTDYICAERFMRRRGQGKGSVSEFTNLQIGLIAGFAYPIETYLIPAAKWKNGLCRTHNIRTGLATDHLLYLLDGQQNASLTPHEADAIGIAAFCMEYDMGKPLLDSLQLPNQ